MQWDIARGGCKSARDDGTMVTPRVTRLFKVTVQSVGENRRKSDFLQGYTRSNLLHVYLEVISLHLNVRALIQKDTIKQSQL